MKRLIAAIGVLAAALLGAVAGDRSPPRADFTYIEVSDILTLDPQRMSHSQDLRLASALHEGLVRWDVHSADFHIVPALATRWDVSDDRTVYTFHLNPEARWSNGDPVRAADLVFAWRRAIMPDTAADYTAMFFHIRGARGFFDRRAAALKEYAARPAAERTPDAADALRREADERFAATVGVEALDDRTLRVTLERPVAYFLDLCAFAPFAPVHPPTIERFTSVDPATGAVREARGWTKPGVLVTNGPYVLREWRFKREIVLERNPAYRGPAAARSNVIRMIPIGDQNTSVLAYQTGAADWHGDVNVDYIPELIEQVRRGERDDFHAFDAFGTYFWNFNCAPRLGNGASNPFHDPRVRRAFAMATNKRDLTDLVRRRGEAPRDSLVPPGSIAGYAPPKGLPFDVDRARRELAGAGWTIRAGGGPPVNASGQRFPDVTMLVPGAPAHHKETAIALGRMWERAFGVTTRVEVKEAKAIKQDLRAGNYMTSRAIWYGDYGDPMTFLQTNRTGDGNNDRAFSSPRYDELLDRAERETDPGARLRLLEEAERLLIEDEAPLIPLYGMKEFHFFTPARRADGAPNPGGVDGLCTHPRMVQYLWAIEVIGSHAERPMPAKGGGS